jgi:hypothetical protein
MLVLGEAVIALLTPTFYSEGKDENYYFFAVLGVTIIFIFTFLYFDMQPRQHEPNALTLGRVSGVLWVALHPPLAFTLFGIGMSLKLLYADLREHKDATFSEELLGGFLGVSVVLMTLIRSTHKTSVTKERAFTFAIRMVLAALHIEVGHLEVLRGSINLTIALHIAICFLLILLDSWKYRHLEQHLPPSHPSSQPHPPAVGTGTGRSKRSSTQSSAGGGVNKAQARRGSVYAPQRSSSKLHGGRSRHSGSVETDHYARERGGEGNAGGGGGGDGGRRNGLSARRMTMSSTPFSFNPQTSMKHSSVFSPPAPLPGGLQTTPEVTVAGARERSGSIGDDTTSTIKPSAALRRADHPDHATHHNHGHTNRNHNQGSLSHHTHHNGVHKKPVRRASSGHIKAPGGTEVKGSSGRLQQLKQQHHSSSPSPPTLSTSSSSPPIPSPLKRMTSLTRMVVGGGGGGGEYNQSVFMSREEQISAALSSFEQSRPHVSIRQVRRSMFPGAAIGGGTVAAGGAGGGGEAVATRGRDRDIIINNEKYHDGLVEYDDDKEDEKDEVVVVEAKQEVATSDIQLVNVSATSHDDDDDDDDDDDLNDNDDAAIKKVGLNLPPLDDTTTINYGGPGAGLTTAIKEEEEFNPEMRVEAGGEEERGDEEEYEYVCYVDEDGNFIDVVDEEGDGDGDEGGGDQHQYQYQHQGHRGGHNNGENCEYEEELVEVVYDIEEGDEEYYEGEEDDDEVEVIYEDPDPPKSHITWL